MAASLIVDLSNIDLSKAAGADGIHRGCYIFCAASVFNSTFHFYYGFLCWMAPTDWNAANLHPSKAKNYSPVSMTIIFCKALERSINSHIMAHLDQHNIIIDQQCWFRRKRSYKSPLVVTLRDLA